MNQDNKSLEIRKCFVNENTNIVQSNFLIERKHKLSMAATQLMFTITGMINKDDDELKEYKVDVTKFSKLWNTDPKNAYEEIKKALTELRKGGIDETFYDPESDKKRFVTVGFISRAEYVEGEGYCLVNIDPILKPHYIQLKENFTKYKFENIIKLYNERASVGQLRLYELLKQYQNIGKREFTIEELKSFLGLIEYDTSGRIIKEKYKGKNSDLRKKVIEPYVETINKSTDIFVNCEIKGRGESAVFIFTIRPNSFRLNNNVEESPKNPSKIKLFDENGNEYYVEADVLNNKGRQDTNIFDVEATDIENEQEPEQEPEQEQEPEIDPRYIPVCMQLVPILPKEFGYDLLEINAVRCVVVDRLKKIIRYENLLAQDEAKTVSETVKAYIDVKWAFDKKKQKTSSTAAFFISCLSSWLEKTFSDERIKELNGRTQKSTTVVGKNSVLEWIKKEAERSQNGEK